MNRGSHRDSINVGLTDWSAFEVDYYIEKLSAVFRKAGMESHFALKMESGHGPEG